MHIAITTMSVSFVNGLIRILTVQVFTLGSSLLIIVLQSLFPQQYLLLPLTIMQCVFEI